MGRKEGRRTLLASQTDRWVFSTLAPELIPIVINVIGGEKKKEPVLPRHTNTHAPHGIPKWSIL